MNRTFLGLAAGAAFAALAAAGSAEAAVTVLSTGSFNATPNQIYNLGTLDTGQSTSNVSTDNVAAGATVTYDFKFNIGDSYVSSSMGSYGVNTAGAAFTNANLQLYSGTVNGTHAFITGVQYDPATDPQQSITANLASGSYFVQTTETAPAGGSSAPLSFSATVHKVSAAPEPSTWLLLLMGVGAMGWALRARRHGVALTAA